jgi:hypothetical protein
MKIFELWITMFQCLYGTQKAMWTSVAKLSMILKQVAEHEPVVSSEKRLAENAVCLFHNELIDHACQ